MKVILQKLTKKSKAEFLSPAKEQTILKTEEKLGIKLPKDYKTFLQITNGFPSIDYTDPTFLPVEEIDYLKNIEIDTIEAFSIEGIENIGQQLSKSILVAGKDEEQYFLLIPPTQKTNNWKYWKFAHWIPGEQEYGDLKEYFSEVLEFLEEIDE